MQTVRMRKDVKMAEGKEGQPGEKWNHRKGTSKQATIPILVMSVGVRMVAYLSGWQMATYWSRAMAKRTDDSVKEKV